MIKAEDYPTFIEGAISQATEQTLFQVLSSVSASLTRASPQLPPWQALGILGSREFAGVRTETSAGISQLATIASAFGWLGSSWWILEVS